MSVARRSNPHRRCDMLRLARRRTLASACSSTSLHGADSPPPPLRTYVAARRRRHRRCRLPPTRPPAVPRHFRPCWPHQPPPRSVPLPPASSMVGAGWGGCSGGWWLGGARYKSPSVRRGGGRGQSALVCSRVPAEAGLCRGLAATRRGGGVWLSGGGGWWRSWFPDHCGGGSGVHMHSKA